MNNSQVIKLIQKTININNQPKNKFEAILTCLMNELCGLSSYSKTKRIIIDPYEIYNNFFPKLWMEQLDLSTGEIKFQETKTNSMIDFYCPIVYAQEVKNIKKICRRLNKIGLNSSCIFNVGFKKKCPKSGPLIVFNLK